MKQGANTSFKKFLTEPRGNFLFSSGYWGGWIRGNFSFYDFSWAKQGAIS